MTTAVGDVSGSDNLKRCICLMTAQATNNSPPSAAGDGVKAYPDEGIFVSDTGAFFAAEFPDLATLCIKSSAGSATMTGTFTLWGYVTKAAAWFPVKVNGGSAIAETSADAINYTEAFTQLGHFDRLYLELSAVGGTATAFEAWLLCARKGCS